MTAAKKTTVNFETRNGRTLSRRTDYHPNGKVAETGLYGQGLNHWAWDIPIGIIREYYDNGQLKSEVAHNEQGARDGESCYYDRKGKLILKVIYHLDRKVKEIDYLAIEKAEAMKNIFIITKDPEE
ncbi:MAG: toxin-antitoxin system YwqK family antitoxin [Bacteriovoracaceae bacterium]